MVKWRYIASQNFVNVGTGKTFPVQLQDITYTNAALLSTEHFKINFSEAQVKLQLFSKEIHFKMPLAKLPLICLRSNVLTQE